MALDELIMVQCYKNFYHICIRLAPLVGAVHINIAVLTISNKLSPLSNSAKERTRRKSSRCTSHAMNVTISEAYRSVVDHLEGVFVPRVHIFVVNLPVAGWDRKTFFLIISRGRIVYFMLRFDGAISDRLESMLS